MPDEDTRRSFVNNLKNLERFNEDYILINRGELESRSVASPIPFSESASIEDDTPAAFGPVEINDYVRTNRIYCIMLYVYWEPLQKTANVGIENLEELRLIRHCLAHHDGNLQKYETYIDDKSGRSFDTQAKRLRELGELKGYIQNSQLIFKDEHLHELTQMVKAEYLRLTGEQI